MLKSTIWKSTFREIRQSFGRFFAILAIIALGVGFFAGLKMTKPDMIETAEIYFEEKNFYDYRVLSTLGFGEEDVDFLSKQKDVRAAEGAIQFDILYLDTEGNQGAIKVHSLTNNVNQVKLLEGRMPKDAQECVVDANLFSSDSIGKKLRLSEENAEEDREHFAYQEYKIVGVVQSPLYLQYERGNTSLGTGRIDGFVYLLPEGFDIDYYTEIYVKFDKDFELYSEEYDTFMEEKELVWESLAQEAAENRYHRLLTDGKQELADAKEELEKEKADTEKELAKLGKELADAEKEIADGEEQLEDAKRELAEGKRTLEEKEEELADAKLMIAKNEVEMANGEKEIAAGIKEWKEQDKILQQSERELEKSQAELDKNKAELTAQEETLLAGEEALAQAEEELSQNEAMIQENSVLLDTLELLFPEFVRPESISKQIKEGREQIAAAQVQIAAGRTQLEAKKQEAAAGRQALEAGKATLAEYQAQLDAGKEQIEEARWALDNAWQQLQDGQQELEDGKLAIEEAEIEIEKGELQIEAAKRELLEGEETLAEQEKEFLKGKREYENGKKDYQEGRQKFQEEIAKAEVEIADAEKELAELEEPDSYVLSRDTNVGYALFENDSSIVEGIANVFPVFFFLVAALVCITTMNRMVEEQRTQIGVLKALGYSEYTIMSKYIFYSGAAAITGCILGYAGGTYLFPRIIWTAYGIMYRIDNLTGVFDPILAILCFTVALLCSVGTTWLSCRTELTEVAAQLMRPKAPKAGKRIFLEYIPFLWKHLSFLKKVSVRNIFRYKRRLLMMVIGISGCTALLLTGFGVKDSIIGVASQQFQEIQLYDISVNLEENIQEHMEKSFSNDFAGYLLAQESTMDLVTDLGTKSINLVVTEPDDKIADFFDLHTLNKESIEWPKAGEAVVTHKIANKLGIQVGDTITLQNENGKTITAKISGINQNFIGNFVYLSCETYEQQMNTEVEYKTVYLNIEESEDVHVVAASLMQLEEVTNVTVNADTMSRFESMLDSMNLIVLVIIICAALLAFIVLYNLTNINITERIREIATIKVLGFYKNEAAAYVFRENILLTAMGAGVGLLLGRWLHSFVINEIDVDMVAFDVRVLPMSYVYSVLLTFVFTWFVNLVMRNKLEKISMTESLKSVD